MKVEKLHIHAESLAEAFSGDARISAMTMPYILARHGYAMIKNKGGGWLVQRDGRTLKVRAMTKDGVNFGPSVSRGAGRHHSEQNWTEGESSIDGFIVFDATNLNGEVQVWEVATDAVNDLRMKGVVADDGFITRLEAIHRICPS